MANRKTYVPLLRYTQYGFEVGCDEAGRGCLAGPVAGAAVCLPPGFTHPLVRDSKTLSPRQREQVREIIEREAIAWHVHLIWPMQIDQINILQAAILAMQTAVYALQISSDIVLVDGNAFAPLRGIPHRCEVKGDQRFISIAAASILAKTHRDEIMIRFAQQYPQYGWERNKGYPTPAHRKAIALYGLTPLHRRSFRCS